MDIEMIILAGVWGFAIATVVKKEIAGWFMLFTFAVAFLTSLWILTINQQ